MSHDLAPWRYLYVLGRPKARPPRDRDDLVEARSESFLDRVVGDEVTLSAVTEGYENLVYKTLEALRWALTHTSFEVLLKTDDDTVVHIGRLWMWLDHRSRVSAPGVPLALSLPLPPPVALALALALALHLPLTLPLPPDPSPRA